MNTGMALVGKDTRDRKSAWGYKGYNTWHTVYKNFKWTRAGMHNIRPAVQMWPAEALHLARQP